MCPSVRNLRQVSDPIPPLAPILVVVELQLGHLILHGKLLSSSHEELLASGLRGAVQTSIVDALVGSLVLGVALSIPAGLATWRWARRREAEA